MDELIEQIGRGALTFVRQNAFWFAVVVPVVLVSVLPIGSGQAVVLVFIYLVEAIAYAIRRGRASS